METKFKIVVLVLAGLLVVSLVIIFGLQNTKSALLQDLDSAKEELLRQTEVFTNRLNAALRDKDDLQQRIGAIQRELDQVSSEREGLQQSHEALRRRYEAVENERAELVKRLNLYSRLQEELEGFKKENQTLRERIDSLTKIRVTLQSEIDKLKEESKSVKEMASTSRDILAYEDNVLARSVSLSPIIVSPSTGSGEFTIPATSPGSLSGKILKIDREYNFVVINLGLERGLKEGVILEVVREGSLLGKLEVFELRPGVSACDIIQEITPFEVGDIARY